MSCNWLWHGQRRVKMSYSKTMENVKPLVDAELEMAQKDNGEKFSSGHEAYAVIKEEVEELEEELELIKLELTYMWMDVKFDDPFGDRLKDIEKHARKASCEAIQVSAMARKAML